MTKLLTTRLDVKFLAQGAFNKVYTVRTDGECLVLRVSLPVDPKWKTTSEVATMEWVRCNTILPVPRVIAYEADQENSLGFEWILMTKIPGTTLSSAWRAISFESKQKIVHHRALFASSLFEKPWRGIGNIYHKSGDSVLKDEISREVGRIVSMTFFWGERLRQYIPRGPFHTSRDWMHACLSLIEGDCKSSLVKNDDEADRKDAERTLGIVCRLQGLLDIVFPSDDRPEPTVLHHDDLSQHNIMVDEDGTLTGVVDWECVSVVPLWKACDYPSFSQGRPRNLKPERNAYEPEENGELDSLYWEHLMDYELTLLRGYFLREM